MAGFLAVAVFRLEDTEGKELDYQRLELPALPLIEVAQSWGISVKAIPGNYQYYGYFSRDRKEISLVSQEESLFFHELAHAGTRLPESPKRCRKRPKTEIEMRNQRDSGGRIAGGVISNRPKVRRAEPTILWIPNSGVLSKNRDTSISTPRIGNGFFLKCGFSNFPDPLNITKQNHQTLPR